MYTLRNDSKIKVSYHQNTVAIETIARLRSLLGTSLQKKVQPLWQLRPRFFAENDTKAALSPSLSTDFVVQ